MTTKTTKTKKTITTADERKLAEIVGFAGKYVSSLLESAAKYCKLEGDARLSDAKSYLKEIDRQHAEWVRKAWDMTPRKYKDLQAKAKSILHSFRTGYSMGEEKILALDGKIFCFVDNCREYSGGCKYQAQHGTLTIRLEMHELRAIEKIEGVWTVRRKGTQADWLKSHGAKGSHKFEFFSGHLVGTSHGSTVEECNALEAEKERTKSDAATEAARFLTRFVGFDDRRIAGACEAGVAAFCERHGLNPEFGYRIDYLIGLGDNVATRYLDRLARLLHRRPNYGIK
jgi:hypothetical protein